MCNAMNEYAMNEYAMNEYAMNEYAMNEYAMNECRKCNIRQFIYLIYYLMLII